MLIAVSLCLWGDKLDPKCITNMLGVEPTRSQTKGETRTLPSNTMIITKTGVWKFNTYPELNSSVLAEHIELLRSRFSTNWPSVDKLPDVTDACVDVFIAISAKEDGTECYFELSPQELASLQQFGIRVEFHVAFTDSDFTNSSS